VRKKKTGLVGPASIASSWMRLHRSTARLARGCCTGWVRTRPVARQCLLKPNSDRRSTSKIRKREETDGGFRASRFPIRELKFLLRLHLFLIDNTRVQLEFGCWIKQPKQKFVAASGKLLRKTARRFVQHLRISGGLLERRAWTLGRPPRLKARLEKEAVSAARKRCLTRKQQQNRVFQQRASRRSELRTRLLWSTGRACRRRPTG
jgi:hypothetical protein